MARFAPTRILCPTDLSEISRSSVRYGLTWAAAFGAKVFALSARELTLPPRYFTADQIETLARQAEGAEEELRAELERWVAGIGIAGVEVEAVVGPGPADRAILRAVEVIQPDLVVMGTHGHSGYNRFLMGSTTEKVVRQIPVPLLTLREGTPRLVTGEQGPIALSLRRILCAADVPQHAGTNLAAVAEMARAFGAELTVLHSLEVPSWLHTVPAEARQDVEDRLRRLVDVHARDLKARVVITEGPAYRRILERAAGEAADLIVVGGRKSGGDVPVFGSTAIRVMRHAPCPVVALPAQGG